MPGRTVVVTGAASGIGAATVERFLATGDSVVGIDLETDGIPSEVASIRADVSDPAAVDNLHDDLGAVDILVNNAGVGSTTSVLDCTADEWDYVMGVNARSVFLMSRMVLPTMVSRQSGLIINVASVTGLVGFPDRAAYSASKGAIIALTKQMAIQFADQGIRCSCVCPGTILTPWVDKLLAESNDREAELAALMARQPIGRLGTASEVAGVIVFLASPEAGFMTGSSVVIDGGIVAG